MTEPSFPRFMHLPKEIRDKIWKYSLPEPRIVHMSSLRTRAQMHLLLNRPDTWNPRSKLEFSFYENGNDLYRGDKTKPEESPLRFACQESREIWQQSYIIPTIRVSREKRVNLGVEWRLVDNCKNGTCISLKACNPAPVHMIPHVHNYYKMSDGRLFHLLVRGFVDMKRDTLIMDPVVFSLVNGDLGLELDISKLRSIAYTPSIEYRPLWKPPGKDGRYEVVEGSQLIISERYGGYNAEDPDINENLVVEQASDARDDLLKIENLKDISTDKKKNIASRDMWKFITQCCPQISSIEYILLGERNTAIYAKAEEVSIYDVGNIRRPKGEWETHEHHLLPLYPSVRKIIMSPENTPIHKFGWGDKEKSGLPMAEIQHHFTHKFNHGVQLEKDFQDYLKEHERSGNRTFWHELTFQVCALGDAMSLGPNQVAEDHEDAEMNLQEEFFDVEPEGEIPFEFVSGDISTSSSSLSLPSNPEGSGSEDFIPQNKGLKVKAPMRGDERSLLYLEMGIYIHWDPRGPVQVTRKGRQ
ncbi:hypothetical protein BOTNAR_0704g00040 [Botryotinia narcissicola]|uniref:2EXR domain-containing protein n=1 Tax=Botryotinia narcissicola TaxID=278944 RepID=A0A4Z1H7G0_9HELO|nr:hypothetical protein BOTNAR_0704g00040 [Botryotinia narcissicola]